MDTHELKKGDTCPNDGEPLKMRRALSAEDFRAATDRENPRGFPAGVDSASPAQVAELGELHQCSSCGYQTRFKAPTPTPAIHDGQ